MTTTTTTRPRMTGTAARKPAADALNVSAIARVYTGRIGCACGCRGNYSEQPATIARVARKILANLEAVEIGIVDAAEAWVSIEVDGRVATAYVRTAAA